MIVSTNKFAQQHNFPNFVDKHEIKANNLKSLLSNCGFVGC